MFFNIVASGSKGNATLIGNNKTLILIDMGVSLTSLKDGLNELNKDIKDINGVFITHEHSDHIKGMRYIKDRKFYALEGTLKDNYFPLKDKEWVNIDTLSILPIKTSHDAFNSCGYLIKDNEETIVYITDTGYVIDDCLKYIKNPTYLIIESNHDISMLVKSNRPQKLKSRIMSDEGHLCNEDSAIYASYILGDKTKEIILAHLSEECNTEQKALAAYKKIFTKLKVPHKNIKIRCAKQYSTLLGGDYEI